MAMKNPLTLSSLQTLAVGHHHTTADHDGKHGRIGASRQPATAKAGPHWAGGVGALAMTSCCILPLAFVSLGVGGVFIAELGAALRLSNG